MILMSDYKPPVVCEHVNFNEFCQILLEKPLVKEGLNRLEINNIRIIEALKCAGADEEMIDFVSVSAAQGSNVMLDVVRTICHRKNKRIWVSPLALQALSVTLGKPALSNTMQLLKEEYGIIFAYIDD